MSESWDCQDCGACCYGEDGWIHVDADGDVEYEPKLGSLVVIKRMGGFVRHSLRMVDGHCEAFRIEGPRVRCSVYEIRPTVCRALMPGDPDCLTARARMGIATR